MKTPGFVGRLMSILKRVKHEVSVDDYVARFAETARISNKWVSCVDFEMEDHFLMMMFVTGLKEEIRYEVQIIEPKSLSEAVESARFRDGELRLKQAQLYVQLENNPPSYSKGTDIITQATDRSSVKIARVRCLMESRRSLHLSGVVLMMWKMMRMMIVKGMLMTMMRRPIVMLMVRIR